MSEFPRELTRDQIADARLIAALLPEIDAYKPSRGIFHWCAGPHYPQLMREYALKFKAAIPALRRMADHLDATQPGAKE